MCRVCGCEFHGHVARLHHILQDVCMQINCERSCKLVKHVLHVTHYSRRGGGSGYGSVRMASGTCISHRTLTALGWTSSIGKLWKRVG